MPDMTVPEYLAHARKLLGATTGDGAPWCFQECGEKCSSIAIGVTHPPVGGEYDEQNYYDEKSDTYDEERPVPVDSVAEINDGNRLDAVAIVEAHNDLVPTLLRVVEAYRKALSTQEVLAMNLKETRVANALREVLDAPVSAFTTEDDHE